MGKPDLAELMGKTKQCLSVDDLKALMESYGIWLNDAAAQAAFKTIESARAASLNDAELVGVTGGVESPRLGTSAEELARTEADQALLAMLERFIF
ncbi:MAG: hypothetical protein KHY83_04325 [Coriobacteriia bacterium]|nr:hypothetical protein [Coriobacteriia bacterium]MBS5477871.1 hypothetical protein [Coriobacteriia bacterium]